LSVGVVERQVLHDASFRDSLEGALRAAGELLVLVCYAQSAGLKDWYLVRDQADLDTVLRNIPAAGRTGLSDRIEVYATGELPHRAVGEDDQLRRTAAELVRTTGEILMASRLEGDLELQDVEAAAEAEDVNEWFRDDCQGERLVGAHPFRHDNDPDAAVFVAYNLGADGTIRPGAY
jgi:hypothetical protein